MNVAKRIIYFFIVLLVATQGYALVKPHHEKMLLKDAYGEAKAVVVAKLVRSEVVEKESLGKKRPFINYTLEILDVLHTKDGGILKTKDIVVYSHAKNLKFKLGNLSNKLKIDNNLLIFVGKLKGKNIIFKSPDLVFEVEKLKTGTFTIKDPGEFKRIFSIEITNITELKAQFKTFSMKDNKK
jgi:hypothetical protein